MIFYAFVRDKKIITSLRHDVNVRHFPKENEGICQIATDKFNSDHQGGLLPCLITLRQSHRDCC